MNIYDIQHLKKMIKINADNLRKTCSGEVIFRYQSLKGIYLEDPKQTLYVPFTVEDITLLIHNGY